MQTKRHSVRMCFLISQRGKRTMQKNQTSKLEPEKFSNKQALQGQTEFKKSLTCNICGSAEFKPGPFERLTISGDKPHCLGCGSLERHRLIRKIWEIFPSDYLKKKRALQFSLDPSSDEKWFMELEISIYEHRNSLDLQDIDRNDKTYDVVICNQILEHVEDDKKAFSELLRVIKDDGFLQMTVPNPILRKETEDWGYPKENFHGHYRHYGIDLIEYFKAVIPDIFMIHLRGIDPVTGVDDYVFFWTKSRDTRDYLLSAFKDKTEIKTFF